MPKLDPKAPLAEPTKIPGGIERLVEIWELLRDRASGGYVKGRVLQKIKGSSVKVGDGTTCSPFTGTVIGMALDPKYPRPASEAYEPYLGGAPLDFGMFYRLHNGFDTYRKGPWSKWNSDIDALVYFNLAKEIDPREMRRGDFVHIEWEPKPGKYSTGHAVFCWDVHLDAQGNVDCFQFIGSNSAPANVGIAIGGCSTFLKRDGAKWKKTKNPMFVHDDLYVSSGAWYTLKGVKKASIDLKTFRAKPQRIVVSNNGQFTPKWIRAARLHYDGAPPEPYGYVGDGRKDPPAHAEVKPVKVPAAEVKKDPKVVETKPPAKVEQKKDKPTKKQLEAEQALAELFAAKWIDVDPGTPDAVADEKSKAAVKDFQKKFGLDDDGVVGKNTRPILRRERDACHRQYDVEVALVKLHKAGVIAKDPGVANSCNDEQTRGAVKAFQKVAGLKETGIPCSKTQEKLWAKVAELAPSASKDGADPKLLRVYWIANHAPQGGAAILKIVSEDVRENAEAKIALRDRKSGRTAQQAGKLFGAKVPLTLALPREFGTDAAIEATVSVEAGGRTLTKSTAADLFVVGAPAGEPASDAPEKELLFTLAERKVWRVKKGGALVFRSKLAVDADGAPNAYHPENKGLDNLRNAGKPGNWYGVVTDTGEKDGTPIVQGPDDPFPGYYISPTALGDGRYKQNDPRRYVDSTKIPYIALPPKIMSHKTEGGAKKGDFAAVLYGDKLVYALFADVGPGSEIGEGSIALCEALGVSGNARHGGVDRAKVTYVVFPRSGNGKPRTVAEIDEHGARLFEEFGGKAMLEKLEPL